MTRVSSDIISNTRVAKENLTRCDQAAFLLFCLTIIVPGTSDHDCPLVELDISQ